MIFSRFVAYKAPLEMSSLRAFRIQKTKPVTSSPSTGSEAPSSSSQEFSQSQETSKDSSQNGNSKHDESTEDVIRPPVTFKFYHFMKVNAIVNLLCFFAVVLFLKTVEWIFFCQIIKLVCFM